MTYPGGRFLRVSIAGAAVLLLAGCMVGPRYHRPAAPVPPAFKGAELTPPPELESGSWKQAQPSAPSEKLETNWWALYNDPKLDELEARVVTANQTLKAAYENYQQSRQQIRIDRARLFPTVGVQPTGQDVRLSQHRPLFFPNSPTNYTDTTLNGLASWEPDLWGSVRRTVAASRAEAQASAAEFANVQLSLQSELAIDYFQLRGLDAQQQILDSTVASFQQYLKLTQVRLKGGVASDTDVALAQTQLDQTTAQASDIGVARAQYEHAIATLTGTPASSFSLPPAPLRVILPAVPVGLPSDLLERRPDVAEAERRADAANQQIGIAQAAFYPSLNLNGSAGFESSNPGTLIQGPSALWTLGASAAETLFDAGRRHAVKEQAIAGYEQTAANYRQTVLQSFQDVEDSLSALSILDREAAQQARAVADANRSLQLSTLQYKRGLSNYLVVITAQTTALANERTASDIATRQATASVQLMKALGGGWNTAQLPKP